MTKDLTEKFIRYLKGMTGNRHLPVCLLRLLDHSDSPPGDDEEVDRGLGGNIPEGNTLVILVEELSGDGAIQDLVEDGSLTVLRELSSALSD